MAAIVHVLHPFRNYLASMDTIVDVVTLNDACVFEWACLKRFQELFARPRACDDALPEFCATGSVLARWGALRFDSTMVDLPKVSPTISRVEWPGRMTLMVDKVKANGGVGGPFKPLEQSSSADVILMQHRAPDSPGSKRSHVESTGRTLTLGLAATNDKSAEFQESHLADECSKFACMVKGLHREEFAETTNIYAAGLRGHFVRRTTGRSHRRLFATLPPRVQQPGIDEVMLLDLTTADTFWGSPMPKMLLWPGFSSDCWSRRSVNELLTKHLDDFAPTSTRNAILRLDNPQKRNLKHGFGFPSFLRNVITINTTVTVSEGRLPPVLAEDPFA